MIMRFPFRLSSSVITTGAALSLLACSEGEVTAQERDASQVLSDDPPTTMPIKAAAMLQRFESAKYTSLLWVRANAAAGGDGSAQRPYATINAALLRARACTEIRVLAGLYRENVRFERNLDGAPDCPIRLVSFDGIGKAQIVAQDPARSAVGGGGSENIVVEGFSITGGKNGIQFGQNGDDWTDLARNIVLRFNTIANPVDDGIKINGAEVLVIAHNSITGGKDEAIDLFGALDVAVVRNQLGPMQTTSGALTIKAGSRNILVSGNSVTGISTHGIVIGGRTGPKLRPRSGFEGFEAADVRVFGNRIENVGKVPLAFLGARNSQAWGNLLASTAGSPTLVVSDNLPVKGSRLIQSSDIRAWGNRYVTTGKKVRIDAGSTSITVDDQSATRWNMVTGPDIVAFKPYTKVR